MSDLYEVYIIFFKLYEENRIYGIYSSIELANKAQEKITEFYVKNSWIECYPVNKNWRNNENRMP